MQKPIVDILLIALTSPIKIGIYQNLELLEEITTDIQASDSLPEIFDGILQKYCITNIIYAKGPGSFMAIKISYVLIKTLEITTGVTILAEDGFAFNGNSPIKANGKRYFIKNQDGSIDIVPLENPQILQFSLPKKIDIDSFSKEDEPLYILPAV